MSSSRIERAVFALASWAPVRLVAEFGPERLLLNFACVLIGLGGLIQTPDGLLELWPAWFVYEWSAGMLVGGVCALWGIVGQARTAEWVGYVCIGTAALIYGVSVLVAFGLDAARIGILFLAVALAKGIRLLLSYAARAQLLRMGREEQGE